MNRYKIEMSDLKPGRVRSWMKKTLIENEKFSVVALNQYETNNGTVRTTLILEDPLLGLMSHLETQDTLLGDINEKED